MGSQDCGKGEQMSSMDTDYRAVSLDEEAFKRGFNDTITLLTLRRVIRDLVLGKKPAPMKPVENPRVVHHEVVVSNPASREASSTLRGSQEDGRRAS